jgi:glycosyltransferase involved in cell wall biosynthesis
MDEFRLPFVSVVMPIRNEADFIGRTIQTILNNDYPKEKLEVIVADGISTDKTPKIVHNLSIEDPRVRLLENKGKIVSTGLNLALRESKGDIFIRIDGHCEIPPDFIRKSVETLLSKSDAWVAGGYWKTKSTGLIGRTISAATQSPAGVGNARHRLGNYDGWVDTLAYGAHHKWILDKIGYFDEQLVRNQDDEFNLRVHLAGGKIWMSSDIWSVYYARNSFKKLWKQYFQYGFWRIRTIQKHHKPATIRQLAPMLLVISLGVLILLSFVWSVFIYLLAAELIVYGLGLFYGLWDVWKQEGFAAALLSPVVFLFIHFGYGIGCLWGIVRFIIFKGAGLPKPEEFKLSR